MKYYDDKAKKKYYLGGAGIIRIIFGFCVVFGAVGNDDYAVLTGAIPVPILETIGWSVLGLLIAAWGASAATKQDWSEFDK